MTREEYMAGNSKACDEGRSHEWLHEYYRQYITDYLRDEVLLAIGCSNILNSTDPHLNDIPLSKWDSLFTQLHWPTQKLKANGDSHSLMSAVCIAKTIAYDYREAHKNAN